MNVRERNESNSTESRGISPLNSWEIVSNFSGLSHTFTLGEEKEREKDQEGDGQKVLFFQGQLSVLYMLLLTMPACQFLSR